MLLLDLDHVELIYVFEAGDAMFELIYNEGLGLLFICTDIVYHNLTL
jgi:hypothetical protein